MKTTAITLSDGTELRFGPIRVWDLVECRERFGEDLDELLESGQNDAAALAAAVNDEDGDEEDAPTESRPIGGGQFQLMLYLAFCSARSGGFEGDFEAFGRAVAFGDYPEVISAAMPYLGKPSPSG